MSVGTAIEQAAAMLRAAERDRVPCAPIRTLFEAGDLASAYNVQALNIQLQERAGRRIAGRKIGLTSASVQRQLGVGEPDYGVLFADVAVPDGSEVPAAIVPLQPRVEAEIAFVLERDLPHADATVADVIGAIAYALPAIEIVGSRIAGWDLSILDTIADNGSSGAYVLGSSPVPIDRIDFTLCGMVLSRHGEPESTGAGAACLGSPLNAALWLAQTMARVGRPLLAGDVVLTGALGPMLAVRPGDFFQARINGLGAVSVGFRPEAE